MCGKHAQCFREKLKMATAAFLKEPKLLREQAASGPGNEINVSCTPRKQQLPEEAGEALQRPPCAGVGQWEPHPGLRANTACASPCCV